ncbi:hypothetical protein BV372_17515 [Nostoc sp. T09]|uniref:hypothetical protein n=1 Tax=Nostoc sp. T09 TaxID=1932621 RepID=UPI000A384967|nr:hypothetical protein [Nostoc sp. T09]OUL32988.1 hypothetical protein BV372_17515 [Nostoc sp. T09]
MIIYLASDRQNKKMTLAKQQLAVGVFAKFSDVELAVFRLIGANFPMIKVSVVCAVTSSLNGVLVGLGIPEDERKVFIDLVSQGYYLVIVKATPEEISMAEKILSQGSIQQWAASSVSSHSTGRYKNAVALFFNHHSTEQALIELKVAGYPMNQVSLVTQGMLLNETLSEVKVFSKDDWIILKIPENIAGPYKSFLALDGYLLVLGGTDIQIAAARTILQANGVEDFHIYHPLVSSAINKF